MTSRILVTGGAGFIGSHLVDALAAAGNKVVVLDDLSTGRKEYLTDAIKHGDVQLIEGSVLDDRTVGSAIKNCDIVFHLAVQCVRRSLSHPLENHDINATGTLKVLEAARRARVRRFVYCSSSEIYGNCGSDWLSEHVRPEPATVYGASKLAGEHYAKSYFQTYGLPVIVVRPFNAYGPREQNRGDLAEVIPRFVIRVLSGQPPVIFGDGNQGRDFTYVTETVEGLVRAAACDALIGDVVNIGFGQMITIRELASAVAKACGRPDLKPIHIEARPGDVHALRADTRRAVSLLKFAAAIKLSDGLKCYVDWFRARHPSPSALLEKDLRNWTLPTAMES